MRYLAIIAALCLPTIAHAQSIELAIAIAKAKAKAQLIPSPTPPPTPGPVKTVICDGVDGCDGTGEINGVDCPKCGGDGRIEVPALPFINAALTKPRIPWTTFGDAQASGKHRWIRFTAADCGPCHEAGEHLQFLASQNRLTKTLSTFACVQDVSPSYRRPSALARRYRVTQFPTDVFEQEGTGMIYRYTGAPNSPEEYVGRLLLGIGNVSAVQSESPAPMADWMRSRVVPGSPAREQYQEEPQYRIERYRVCGPNGCVWKTRRVRINRPAARGISYEYPFIKAPIADPPDYPEQLNGGSPWTENGSFDISPEHLAREHGFDLEWVQGLSRAARLSLHSDAHNGRVREEFVVR